MTFYTDPQRKLQDQFQTRPLADAVAAATVVDELDDNHINFIQSRDFFFLSTVNAAGEPTVSHKGGDIGTVHVVDGNTLVFPAYDGNGMFLSLGNIVDTAKIGLLFMDFETPNRIRVQASATLVTEPKWLKVYPGAVAVVRVHVDKVFVNCARYIHKHTRTTASPYVPDQQGQQPVPKWKRIKEMQDFLPPDERAKVSGAGGTITRDEYGVALQNGNS